MREESQDACRWNFFHAGRSKRANMPAVQGRVLLAVSAQTRKRLLPCLSGYEIVWAQTVGEVRVAAAQQRFDLVIVGSHFDESHTFDIVRHVRDVYPGACIACVRGRPFPGALGKSTLKAFRSACEALGVGVVVDLFDYPDSEAGSRAIGALFERQLANVASPPAA